MEKTKKLTKKDNFTTIRNILEELGKTELVTVMEHELELLEKKNSADRKPTENQIANNSIKETIVELLVTTGKRMTISEMMKASDELGELTNQRISALIRQLMAEGKVDRIEDKRKAYFFAV